jgi:hypothetical protein
VPYVAYQDGFKATVMNLVETAPSAAINAATDISTTSATLNGAVNDNVSVTTVTFNCGLTTDYSSSVPGGTVAAGSGITPVSTVISGLTCGTTYHFRVTAANSAGTTNSNDATFTTAACLTQAITFGTAPTIIVGGTGTASATAGGSGNPVVFGSQTPSVCTVSGTNGSTVTGVSTGTCTIAANQAGNAGYAAASQTTQSFTIAPATATLTITLSGTGGGSVNSAPAGIACTSDSSADCSHPFTYGTPVTLIAAPDWKSIFSGWGLPCGGTGSCRIDMNGATEITATFTPNYKVRIPGPSPVDYASLQEAYDHANDGDVLRARTYSFAENLTLNRPITVTIGGGLADDYLGIGGVTELLGVLTMEKGTVTIDRLSIR